MLSIFGDKITTFRKLAEEAVGNNKLFVAPFDIFALVANSGKVYRHTKMDDLKIEIN